MAAAQAAISNPASYSNHDLRLLHPGAVDVLGNSGVNSVHYNRATNQLSSPMCLHFMQTREGFLVWATLTLGLPPFYRTVHPHFGGYLYGKNSYPHQGGVDR